MSADGPALDGGGQGIRRWELSPLRMEFLQRGVIVIDVAMFQKQTDGKLSRFSASQVNVAQLAQISMDQTDVRYALRREYGRRFQGVVPRNDQVDQKLKHYSDLSCRAILEVSSWRSSG